MVPISADYKLSIKYKQILHPAVPRFASFGALIPDSVSCFSGGGPPFGCPRIIIESPERICINILKKKNTALVLHGYTIHHC